MYFPIQERRNTELYAMNYTEGFNFLQKILLRAAVLAAGIACIGVIGYLDFVSGKKLSLYVFYLIPVFLASWFGGGWEGMLSALAASLMWYFVDMYAAGVRNAGPFELWDLLVRCIFFFAISFFMLQLKSKINILTAQAETDFLTKIKNRRGFVLAANKQLRKPFVPLCVIYIDLDNFKSVNDSEGHEAGDKLLKLTAKRIKEKIRVTDTLARMGGDEFSILMPGMRAEQAENLVKSIRDKLLEDMDRNRWDVTFSTGIVAFINPVSNVDEMLRRADEVMYSVKNSGKNSIKTEKYM